MTLSTPIVVRIAAILALAIAYAPGCAEKERRSNGSLCASDDQCASGFCYSALCLDPEADDDEDGLINSAEMILKTKPFQADSDGDGIGDGAEVGGNIHKPHDTDGDNDGAGNTKHDALESALADIDQDCIKDQFDPSDNKPATDPFEVGELQCSHQGVCGGEGIQARGECTPVEAGDPELECSYVDVEGDALQGYDGTVETTCDGLDNDCDGVADEGLGITTDDGVALAVGETCDGTGVCSDQAGEVECAAGVAVCSVNKGGSGFDPAGHDEVQCNNQDDDCDGQTDTGVTLTGDDGTELAYGDPCTPSGACAFNVEGNVPGSVECYSLEGIPTGVCSTGPGGSLYQGSEEKCDTIDNDCDGHIDEDMHWTGPDGVDLLMGSDCGLGLCQGGVVTCKAGETTCSTADLASGGSEQCNGIDDDCDGEVDEPQGLAMNCPAVGICADIEPAGVYCTVEAEAKIVCNYAGVAGFETQDEWSCNGLDDDCDGSIDENLQAPDGTVLGAPCAGQGACSGKPGTIVCPMAPGPAGEMGAVCSADQDSGVAEDCNGQDDDCDGDIDEGDMEPPDGLGCSTLGVCASTSTAPAVCSGGDWVCASDVTDDFEGVEATCDGQDNDCDGQVDEGTPGVFDPSKLEALGMHPPHRRRWPAARMQDGTLFLYGGLHPVPSGDGSLKEDVLLDDAWLLDPASGLWKTAVATGESPGPRWGHAVTWEPTHELVLVHGGTQALESAAADASGDLMAWDPLDGTWLSVAQIVDTGVPPPRRHHGITALGDGRIVVTGGDGPDPDKAVFGQLDVTGAAGEKIVTCYWEKDAVEMAHRQHHGAVYDAAQDLLILAGGSDDAGYPAVFVESWQVEGGTEWKPLGDPANQPADMYLDPTVVVAKNALLVLGGRDSLVDDGSVLSGGWMLPFETGTWKPSEWPKEVGGAAGGVGWWNPADGQVYLLPGAASAHASWASVWTLNTETGVWGAPQAWSNPAARIGAAMAVRWSTGDVWLLGGSRAPGHHPLQDAWALSPAANAWDPLVAPLAEDAVDADKTRPSAEGASAIWDPVAKRVLIFGGRVSDGANMVPSTSLWAYLPDEGEFEAMDAQGVDPLPMAPNPVFGVAPGESVAWLAGDVTDDPGGDTEHQLAVYRLDLAVLEWELVDEDLTTLGAAWNLLRVAGGVDSNGLQLALLDGASAILHGSLAGDTLTTGAPSAATFTGIVTYAWDPVTSTTLLWAKHMDGYAQTLVISHSDGSITTFAKDPAAPPAVDAALVVHPLLGAVGYGGRGPAGVTLGARVLFGQSCP